MTKAHTILGAVAAASIAGAASADISITFENFIAPGAQFEMLGDENGDVLSGSIESAVGDFVMNTAGEDFTWCDDLTVMIANDDLSDLYMQIGGYSDFGAAYRFTWPTGASGDAGTVGGGIAIEGESIDVSGYRLWLGNGYASGGNGDWSGAIDLGGISFVPAPGALALLGLAGVSARRRRN